MATGSDKRMVLHDIATHAVIYVNCEDIARLKELPQRVEGPGCHIECTELGARNEYYVRESFEAVCEYVTVHAPEVMARMTVSLVES